MEIKNYHVEKLCGFYVSDWHLATTVLPYINSKIEENTKVITFLENNIEKNIQILMQKLNLKNKNDILKIRWKNIIDKKYHNRLLTRACFFVYSFLGLDITNFREG